MSSNESGHKMDFIFKHFIPSHSSSLCDPALLPWWWSPFRPANRSPPRSQKVVMIIRPDVIGESLVSTAWSNQPKSWLLHIILQSFYKKDREQAQLQAEFFCFCLWSLTCPYKLYHFFAHFPQLTFFPLVAAMISNSANTSSLLSSPFRSRTFIMAYNW